MSAKCQKRTFICDRRTCCDGLLGPPFGYSVIAIVGDEHAAIIGHRNGNGVEKVALSAAFAAETGQEGSVGGKFLDAMIVEISREDIASGADSQAGDGGEPTIKRPMDIDGKGTTPFMGQSPIGFEDLNAVVIAVGDIEHALCGQGDIGGVVERGRGGIGCTRG